MIIILLAFFFASFSTLDDDRNDYCFDFIHPIYKLLLALMIFLCILRILHTTLDVDRDKMFWCVVQEGRDTRHLFLLQEASSPFSRNEHKRGKPNNDYHCFIYQNDQR